MGLIQVQPPIFRGFAKAIVIVRDPLFAALSEFHRIKSGSERHISHANSRFFDQRWHAFALKYLDKWKFFHQTMMQRYKKNQLCFINYENLKQDVIGNLTPCLSFIGFDVSQEKATCIMQEMDGKHHRPAMADKDLDLAINQTFTQQELKKFHDTYQNIISKTL